VPTAGVTFEDAADYVTNGAIAVALGGALVSSDAERTRDAAARITALLNPSRRVLES
jgi:2-keto-3-deoxy-6-phosphogluconate aldolase